jgi:hypothetical protein
MAPGSGDGKKISLDPSQLGHLGRGLITKFHRDRGTSDCKGNVVGILSTIEYMLERGFKPRRTILLAFGQDEEADGNYGALYIAKYLEERYGRDGIGIIVDEGGMGLEEKYGVDLALPGVAEKGEFVRDWTLSIRQVLG